MPRLRTQITFALLAAWWLLFGAAVGVAVAWTTKALAERGLARGPRWATGMERPWPHTLPKDYAVPDDWMRVTEWWHTQDIGTWRKHKTYLITEASYGLPLRSVGELIAQQTTAAGPMLMDAPGTTAQSGLLAGLPLKIRWPGFAGNAAIYGALGWWLIRGRRWNRARRRRAAGRCPECGELWSATSGLPMCAPCDEWKRRPRVRTWYWWKTTLAAPWWLAVGGVITLAIAWGGPYLSIWIGDHFISQIRRPCESWPGRTASLFRTRKPDFVDPASCWWGTIDSYTQGWQHVRLVRAGSPFPCCAGVWSAAKGGYVASGFGWNTGALGPTEDVWELKIPKHDSITFPHRVLWMGMMLDVLFWAVLAWFAWRGPAALRRWRWRRGGRCGECGYDLKGLATGARCPECGTVPGRETKSNAAPKTSPTNNPTA